jgi:hypothetical protein
MGVELVALESGISGGVDFVSILDQADKAIKEGRELLQAEAENQLLLLQAAQFN